MRLRRAFAGDSVWGVLDQALISLGNFGVGLAVARAGGPEQFGLWAIGFAFLLLALGFQRALATDPFLILEGGGKVHALGRFVGFLGAGHALLALAGLVAVGLLPSHQRLALAIVVALIPFLLQDAVRSILLVRRGPRSLAANDALTGLAQVALAVVIAGDAAGGVVALGGGCAVGVLAGFCALRACARVEGAAPPSWRRLWATGRWFALESAAYTATAQLVPPLAASVAGAAVLGSVRAGLAFFAPLQLVVAGLHRVWLVDLSRSAGHGQLSARVARRRRRLALAALVWGVIGVAVGAPAIALLYGSGFQLDAATMAALGAWAVLQAWYSVAMLEAKVELRGRSVVASRLCAGLATLAAVAVAGQGGAPGIALALALGQLGGVIVLRSRATVFRVSTPARLRDLGVAP